MQLHTIEFKLTNQSPFGQKLGQLNKQSLGVVFDLLFKLKTLKHRIRLCKTGNTIVFVKQDHILPYIFIFHFLGKVNSSVDNVISRVVEAEAEAVEAKSLENTS